MKPIFIRKIESVVLGGGIRGRGVYECQYCKEEFEALNMSVKNGDKKSCGCVTNKLKASNLSHGHTVGGKKSRLYITYSNMLKRCYYVKSKDYGRYGGAGIKVCDEWRYSFDSFAQWAYSNGYSDELTIDRIDNYKGYSPDNCKWSTYKEQSSNKRKNGFLIKKKLYFRRGKYEVAICGKYIGSFFTKDEAITKINEYCKINNISRRYYA